MSSEGELVNISIESLEKLRDLYEYNWPQHINAFCYIDSMITRFKNFPETREINKIYTINGKVEGDATFVSIMVREKMSLYFSESIFFEKFSLFFSATET